MDKEKLQERIDKLEVLRLRGTDGEKIVAEKALKRLLDKYGLKPSEGLDEDVLEYKKGKLNPYLKDMLGHIVHKHGGLVFDWVDKNNFNSVINFSCTDNQRKKIMGEFNRHKKGLNEYLNAMTDQYIRQNNLCSWREPEEGNSIELTLSEIDKMMMGMDLETEKEEHVRIEETKRITGDD